MHDDAAPPGTPPQSRFAAAPASLSGGLPGDPAERALLGRCRRFRHLEAHAAVVCRALGIDPASSPSLQATLERFVREGHLVSESDVVGRIAAHLQQEKGSRGISTVGFVTRDRPRIVARGVVSYAAHAARHGRDVRIVVMDDGSDGAVPEVLADACRDLDGPVEYAGPAEKRAFARRLAQVSGVPPDVVAFALLDPFETGATYGANRNALFLDNVGELVLSGDDDTLLRPFLPPGASSGLAVAGGRPPIDYWFFPGLATAMGEVAESGEDVFQTLDGMLGRSVSTLFAEAGERVDLERVGHETLAALLRDPGSVVAVMLGMLGDAGGESPLYAIRSARGASHHAMVATEASYRTAVTSRDHLRAVRTPALSRGGFLMTTAIAFDMRQVMPPFFPVFRCEDNLYGDVLRCCRPNDWVGHVPTSLVHHPEETRRYAHPAGEEPGVRLHMAALTSLLMDDAELGESDPDARQRALGRHLVSMARTPALEATLREKAHRSFRDQVRYLRLLKESHADSPVWWHQDMDRQLSDITAIPPAAPVVPREVGSLEDVRTLVEAYGRLLECWPDLWRGASELKARGESVAKPLQR